MNMKRLIGLVMAGILCIGTMAGCGKEEKKVANSTTDIEIRIWNSGSGTAWLDQVIEGFEKKYPEYHVTYTASSDAGAVKSTFGLSDIDTTDLYLAMKNYEVEYMEPLNDVLDSTPEGDSYTIREKLNPGYLSLEQYSDGNVYTLTWGGGIMSFVYNEKIFKEAGITQLPRTTDELAVVCDTLHKKGITPLCHFKDGGYYNFLSETFFAQYNGKDYYYNDFYGCKGESGEDTLSLELFTKKDGRYKTLQAYEKFITPDYTLTGSNSNTHTYMQTQFIAGSCAMMLSGAWMSNEMASVGSTDDFKMMKLPVISSIIDNLTSITKEAELRKVITAVDAVTDGAESEDAYRQGENYVVDGLTVTSADWQRVREARNMIASNQSGQSAYIPNYSNAKEATKEFLKYFYSDEGQRVFMDAVHYSLPYTAGKMEINTEGWNSFATSVQEVMDTTESFISNYNCAKHAIYHVGGTAFGQKNYTASLSSMNASDRKTADDLWEQYEEYCKTNYETNWLANMK